MYCGRIIKCNKWVCSYFLSILLLPVYVAQANDFARRWIWILLSVEYWRQQFKTRARYTCVCLLRIPYVYVIIGRRLAMPYTTFNASKFQRTQRTTKEQKKTIWDSLLLIWQRRTSNGNDKHTFVCVCQFAVEHMKDWTAPIIILWSCNETAIFLFFKYLPATNVLFRCGRGWEENKIISSRWKLHLEEPVKMCLADVAHCHLHYVFAVIKLIYLVEPKKIST